MATPEEIIAMNEAEQQRLAAAGLGGIGSKTVTPTPALAPSANAYVAPEIPQITSLSTPPPIEPAPTLGDGQVSAANELLGNAAHDASLGTVAGDPTVSPAVAATSQAADQTNAAIQAKAEPTGAAFAEAVFGDPKPAQSQAPVDPNDPYAADRNKMEKDGVKAIDESFKIEMGAATRDDRHLNPETGAMDPGGNNILDAEEIAAHVSSIESAWREADEGIKARVALDYKNNLEKLQEEQHRIKAQYSAMVDEVANTYINPAELWDKGGFGARIGIPGAAFLDTFFAMKGWNVPSFSAQWDKAVEGNVIAQKSKLTQKTGKLAGFEKLWDMAGQIATNEKEQIAYTSDLLKAATMGQYVHQLAPFKSLAAAADAQAMKADAMRKIGTMMMNQVNNMDQMALRRKTQADADALARLKYELEAEKLRQLKNARQGGTSTGSMLRPMRPGEDATKSGWAAYNAAMQAPNGTLSPSYVRALAPKLQALDTQNKIDVMAKIVDPTSKPGQYRQIMKRVGGRLRLVGIYDGAKENTALKDIKEKTAASSVLEDDVVEFNNAYRDVMREYKGDPSTAGLTDYITNLADRITNNKKLSAAEARVLAIYQKVSVKGRHDMLGASQTASEIGSVSNWLPPATNSAGKIKFGTSRAMAFATESSLRELGALDRNGSIRLVVDTPVNEAESSLKIIAEVTEAGNVALNDMDISAAEADNVETPAVITNASDSPLIGSHDYAAGVPNAGRRAMPDAVKETYHLLAQGKTEADLSPKQLKYAANLNRMGDAGYTLIQESWNDDKADYWQGSANQVGTSIKDAEASRSKVPSSKRAKLDAEIHALEGVQAKMQAYADDNSMRGEAVKSKATLDKRDKLATEYRNILNRIYLDGGAALDAGVVNNPSILVDKSAPSNPPVMTNLKPPTSMLQVNPPAFGGNR